LVCLGRPHLADPYWTLHAAAKFGDRGESWPLPYHPGRDQLFRITQSSEPAANRV
jgi:anthraniloyl-CoA monooxygenase